MNAKKCLIAIGNRFRGDDAIGPLLLDALKPNLPEAIDTFEEAGDIAKLLDLFQRYDNVFIIDAMQTGKFNPGMLYCLNAHDDDLLKEDLHTSTHAFSLSQAIELAKTLGFLPEVCMLYGIEGHKFGQESGLSHAVEMKMPELQSNLLEMICCSMNLRS